MKRKLCAVLLIVAFVLNCVSCSHTPVPELSNEYLVGLSYGGLSWGMIYDCIDARVIVCTNRDILVYMPTTSSELDYEETLEKVATFELTEEQYNAINEVLDREKLYNMKVESNTGVCDGDGYYLILYGKDGEIVKKCGAYEPTSKNFMEIYRTVIENIPRDKIVAVRDEYAKELEIKDTYDDTNTDQ